MLKLFYFVFGNGCGRQLETLTCSGGSTSTLETVGEKSDKRVQLTSCIDEMGLVKKRTADI